jgi:hypothetical protein
MAKYCEESGEITSQCQHCEDAEVEEPKDVLTKKHDKETQLEREVYKLIEKVKNGKKDLNWRQWFRIEEAIDLLVTDVQKKMMDCKTLTQAEQIDNPNYYHN